MLHPMKLMGTIAGLNITLPNICLPIPDALCVSALQCVPVNSGFGKIAAFLARPRKAIYTMPGLNWAGYGPRSCGPAESDSVYRLADNWSGF